MDTIATIVVICLLVISLVACLAAVAPALQTEAKTRQTQAETQQVEAQAELTRAATELTESETSQESQRVLSEVVSGLLAEVRAERERFDRYQQEQFELLTELVREQKRPVVWPWVIFAVIGGIVALMLLRRRVRVVILLPPDASNWLSVGSADLVPWQEPGAIEVVETGRDGQEIAIE